MSGAAPRLPSRERLEKTDDRPDHFASREERVIIVIGVGKHEERLGSHRGIVQAPTILDGDDAIAPACDDQQRHSDPANPIDRREPVPEKKTHRQKRIVMLSHVGHRRERRSQDERRRWVIGREVDRHCSSQRVAEVHDPRRIDVGATGPAGRSFGPRMNAFASLCRRAGDRAALLSTRR